jgi:hypothetical protein
MPLTAPLMGIMAINMTPNSPDEATKNFIRSHTPFSVEQEGKTVQKRLWITAKNESDNGQYSLGIEVYEKLPGEFQVHDKFEYIAPIFTADITMNLEERLELVEEIKGAIAGKKQDPKDVYKMLMEKYKDKMQNAKIVLKKQTVRPSMADDLIRAMAPAKKALAKVFSYIDYPIVRTIGKPVSGLYNWFTSSVKKSEYPVTKAVTILGLAATAVSTLIALKYGVPRIDVGRRFLWTPLAFDNKIIGRSLSFVTKPFKLYDYTTPVKYLTTGLGLVLGSILPLCFFESEYID